MSKQAARLRRPGYNQIAIAISGCFENLIDHNAVPEMHFSRDAQAVEFPFLPAQIGSELGFRLEYLIDIFSHSCEVGIHRGRLSHYVQQSHRCAYVRGELASEFHGFLGGFFSASTNDEPAQLFWVAA